MGSISEIHDEIVSELQMALEIFRFMLLLLMGFKSPAKKRCFVARWRADRQTNQLKPIRKCFMIFLGFTSMTGADWSADWFANTDPLRDIL
jgi:hypothetical protein